MIGRKKPVSAEAACLKMADLCSRAEQSTGDIMDKLRKMGLNMTDITQIIQNLTQRKFIDDRRFGRAYANDKLRFSGWGPCKIRLGLIKKRLPADIIDEALGELDMAEVREVALRSGRSKSRQLDLAERDDRIRLLRFLASRGFDLEMCKGVVRDLSRETKEA